VRVFDVTAESGKIYQYRMRVKMANPNYKRTENVASDRYAEDTYLTSEGWYTVPRLVEVPPEMLYYAVDQRELEASYTGINSRADPDRRKQTVLQIHRWLKDIKDRTNDTTRHPVGEWVVAERVIVTRGEYVGRDQRIEVPIYKTTSEKFVLATDRSDKATGAAARLNGYKVNFGYYTNDTVLVDFEGGAEQSYDRPGPNKGDRPITFREKAPSEVLLFTHEGKLIALDGEADKKNKERQATLDDWRGRVRKIKEDLLKQLTGGNNVFGGP
jgi:hypothetical protein